MKKYFIILLLLCGMTTSAIAQKWEHLADTPQMGWSTWNKFGKNINEEKIVGIIDAMVNEGLRDAGYVYVNIDDCWHGKRDANGFITEDRQKFPHGLKWLADYAHSKGMKLGIYSDCGTATCAGAPGSLGHEYQDALQYARWGMDYLKEDWCNTPDINPVGAYTLMRDALRDSGRPIFFSMCEWGSNKSWRWAKDISHSSRISGDIGVGFTELVDKNPNWRPLTVMEIVAINDTLRQYAGPGHWNDPDMLEVGNGMTVNEDRAHFTLWCMMAAPLILGNDLRTMTQETKDIIMNRDLIAVNQDKLGVQAWHFCDDQGLQFWFKPLENGDWAMTILNATDKDVKYALNWQKFNLTDTQVSKRSTDFDKKVYAITNLWTHKKEGKTSLKNKAGKPFTIPTHDVVAYRLSEVKK